MTNKQKLIEIVINKFQQYKGKASMYCFNKDVIPEIIYTIANKIIQKRNNSKVFIVVDEYKTRLNIISGLKNINPDFINNNNIKLLSKDYINLKYHYNYDLIITVGVNEEFILLNKLNRDSMFMLSILTKNIINNEFITNVRQILPDIDIAKQDNAIKIDNIYSPVEEHRIPVTITDKDLEEYNKYTEYINTSISIFGNLETIEKCKYGDLKSNISSAEIRNTIARYNGWSEELDTSLAFHKQIDYIYNPNNLYERACNFYNISKQRRDFITDYKSKLQAVLEIVSKEENKNKKILIVSKRGEFASDITKYLNQNNILCGDYHDCIDDAVATDEYGNVILVKSGPKKGTPKIIGAQAISSSNERRFNDGLINVLSIKNSSNTRLKITCDLLIFTSPICENIIDIKKRFTNIDFVGTPFITYVIYCDCTIEHNKLLTVKSNNIVTVIDECKENFISYDEISGDIIL